MAAQAPVADFKDGLQDAPFVDLEHGWAQWTDPQGNSHMPGDRGRRRHLARPGALTRVMRTGGSPGLSRPRRPSTLGR